VCYWGTWANYRPNAGKFTPESIDASLCTHLIYSFVGLDSDTHGIKSLDPWMDLVGRIHGVDVMITIFCDFCQFSAKKLAFFSKTNVMITIFAKTSSSLSKKRQYFR
jgi:GH18 family chitinase